MKAKILGFFCSLLIINFAYGQTIDGVLYTNFNNYYKWRGGAFDSTFLLPQTSATNGKRAGALRYSAADSSVYSWSGSQWRKVGVSIDTSSLSNRIDLRVKYTDTAAMLSPYLRSNVAAATYQPIGNYDTATVVKAYVTNAEAVTITKGQVVYIFGASGDRASVKLAKNTSDTFSSKTLGIVRADIAAGAAGWITTQGQVSGINLGAYSPGDILWLDSVAGGFTATKPQAPYHAVFVGVVERANAGNGLIYVKPQNGVELDELHDVRITSVANNEIIRYNSSLGYWENKSITTTLGYTPLNVTDTTAMLSPYLRKVDTLSLSNRITNATGVQWAGIDSNYAERQSLNGFHEVDETMMRGSVSNTPGLFEGSKYRGVGNWNGDAVDDVNFISGNTGTTSTGSASLTYGTIPNRLYVPSSSWFVYTTRVKIPVLNDGTQKFYVNMGIVPDIPPAVLTEGVGFLYDLDGSTTGSSASANWQTYSVNNSTRTFNQNYTGVAVSADTWTKLKIIFNSSVAYFYVNNTLIATHTNNIPAGENIVPCSVIRKTAGLTSRSYHVDYQTIDIKYSTPR